MTRLTTLRFSLTLLVLLNHDIRDEYTESNTTMKRNTVIYIESNCSELND